MRRLRSLTSAAALGLVLFAGPTAMAGVTFSDDSFPDEKWTHITLVTAGGSFASAQQRPDGGNPGPYQRGVHTFGRSRIVVAHLLDTAIYDPAAQRPLSSASVSFDFLSIAGAGNCGPDGSRNPVIGANVLLRQGSRYFTTSDNVGVAQSCGWIDVSPGPLADVAFGAIGSDGTVDPTVHPDFGPSGEPIHFGYLTSAGTSSPFCERTWGADNFVVELLPVPNVRMTRFDVLQTTLGFGGPSSDRFAFAVIFEAGAASDGIHPEAEDVTVVFGGYRQTLPAGSMHCRGGECVYEQSGPGITRAVIAHGLMAFVARDVDLSGTANPVIVSVVVGDDEGGSEVFVEGSLGQRGGRFVLP